MRLGFIRWAPAGLSAWNYFGMASAKQKDDQFLTWIRFSWASNVGNSTPFNVLTIGEAQTRESHRATKNAKGLMLMPTSGHKG